MSSVEDSVQGRTSDARTTLQSVDRASAVLEILSKSAIPLAVTQVAAESGLERTIVHRLLRTLAANGLATRTAAGFALGPRLLRLGNAYLDRLAFRDFALPFAIDISNSFTPEQPWMVNLAVPVESWAVIVDRLWRPGVPLDILLNDVGTRFPLDQSGTGISMLSRHSDEVVRDLVGQERLEQLRPQLEEIRARGPVVFTPNFRPGLSSIAASVGGENGVPVGGISVIGLGLEPEMHERSAVAMRVSRAAQSLTARLAVAR